MLSSFYKGKITAWRWSRVEVERSYLSTIAQREKCHERTSLLWYFSRSYGGRRLQMDPSRWGETMQPRNCRSGSSCCGSVVSNPTRIYDDVGLIPDLLSLGWGSSIAMSCGVGHRCGLDLMLLWQWHRPAATAPIRPLTWNLYMQQVWL